MHPLKHNQSTFRISEKEILDKKNMAQFAPFEKEGGLLPSFSVHIEGRRRTNCRLIPEKMIEDFTFYDSNNLTNFCFSFCNLYCNLSKDYKQASVILPIEKSVDEFHKLSYLLMQAYMYRLVSMEDFMIHAAAAVFDGEAILFCGQSGAGKSTQANLWREYLSAKVLNYDKPCILNRDGKSYVHGSPWSGKEALYLNEYAPLKAIVFVKQSKDNRITQLSKAQAFAYIFLHNYVYPISAEIDSLYSKAISVTIEHIPVYELSCDISEKAVEVLHEELFSRDYLEDKKEYGMKYKTNDCFEMKIIADEYLLIPRGKVAIELSSTVVFNESGAYLWKKLKTPISKSDLINSLEQHYSISHEEARNDVENFINRMLADKLILIEEPGVK